MGFAILFERAGAAVVGDYLGGEYAFEESIQIDRIVLTALAGQVATVFDLLMDGQSTGYQFTVQSGLPGGGESLTQWFNPPIVIETGPDGLTPALRWQCISGASDWADAPSELDLVTWAERLIAFPPNIVPFSGGELVSPALSEAKVEAAAQALFAEWLGDYFDGNTHPIGVNASGVFPISNIRFEQGEIQQPLNQTDVNALLPQVEIRLTMQRQQERRDVAAAGFMATAPVVLNFWVRAKKQGKGQGAYMVRTVSELLYSILNNPENTLALAEKGITHLAPRGGVTVPSKDWSEMLVSARADMIWWIYFERE